MKNWPTILFACSAAIPLVGLLARPPEVVLIIYPVFVLAWFLRGALSRCIMAVPGPGAVRLLVSFLFSGMATETLAWWNNYLKAAPLPTPGLFHPQLFADLLVGSGFYSGWALAWVVALRWFRFALWQTFVITGLQGIFLEQLGAAFAAMARAWPVNPIMSIVMGLYVFVVHGSIVGLGMVPILHTIDRPSASVQWSRFPIVICLMVGLASVGCWFVALLALPFGGLPPKRFIVDHPFW
jgi:hypothetical protein